MDGRRDDLGSTWVLRNLRKKNSNDTIDDGECDDRHARGNTEKGEKKEAVDHGREVQPATTEIPEVQDSARRAKLEGDDRLRVLAYSDSDSDVESHMRRVKDHLLPPSPEVTEEAQEQQQQQQDADQEIQALAHDRTLTHRGASMRALSGLVNVFGGALGTVARHLTPDVLVRTAILAALQTVHPQVGNTAQLVAGIAGAAGLMARSRETSRREDDMGGYYSRRDKFQFQAMALGKAAVAIVTLRLVRHLHQRIADRRLLRLSSGVNVSALEEAVRETPDKPPETAAEWAVVYLPEMQEMRRMIRECGIELPQRFHRGGDAELIRFARACGLFEAETPAERGKAIERAVRRIINTCEWMAVQSEPLSDVKLKRWERLVAWRGAEASGCPILLVRLGRALQLCTRSGRLEQFAAAIAAQVTAGVESRLSDAPGGAERIVAVVDCRETSQWELFTRSRETVSLAKRLAADLVAHYPGRLEKCHILEAPLLAKVGLNAVLAPLAQNTRDRIVPASAADESLPVTMALLQKRRSYAQGLGRAMSDISLAASEASTPRRTTYDDAEGEEGEECGGNEQAAAAAEEGEGTTTMPGHRGIPAVELCDVAPPRESSPEKSLAVPGDNDVATNLLQSLEEAAGVDEDHARATKKIADARGSPGNPVPLPDLSPQCSGAGAAPVSHTLPSTLDISSSLSPQTTEGSETFHDVLSPEPSLRLVGSPVTTREEKESSLLVGSGGDSFSSGSSRTLDVRNCSPWVGLASMFNSMFSGAYADGGAGGRGGRSEAQSGSGWRRTPRLRAHRLSSMDSQENISEILPETPQMKKKGGILDLPPRTCTQRIRTPAKPSLRRTRSQEAPRSACEPLGSFPLRRQSSVSWAEALESVREIESTPERSLFGVTDTLEGVITSPVAQEVVCSAEFPTMVVLLMCAGLLQRLFLGM